MIAAADFCRILLEQGYDYFTGVPCSFFKGVINVTQEHPEMKYVIAANEGAAVGLAAGAYLAGRQPAIMLQNSGLGNMVNPLTSLSQIYQLPTLLLISGRAYQVADEPQHEIIGACMAELLTTIGIPCEEAATEEAAFAKQLKQVTQNMLAKKMPSALIIKKGTISDHPLQSARANNYPVSRYEAIRMIAERSDEKTLLVATTGMPARELFAVADRPANLYLMGSLGHAMAVGLSLATERPDFKVVVIDGDGSVIMHMGSLSMIGYYKPKNFIHVVLDNEAYESTGNQDTTSVNTEFTEVAQACDYRQVVRCEAAAHFAAAFQSALQGPGPHLIHMKVNRRPQQGIPRITTRHSAPEIARNFKTYLEQHG